MFENDVKTYGTQAIKRFLRTLELFENDVKTYGTQAIYNVGSSWFLFENDVKTYGTQANALFSLSALCLRMM